MNRLITAAGKVVRGALTRKWVIASAAALTVGGGLIPSAAMAGGYDRYDGRRYEPRDRVNVDIRIGDRCEPRYEERTTRVWVPAVYRTVCEKKWIEPVYRTECTQVWVPPVYQTVCEKVWIPEVYETREVRYFDGHCYRTRCERVLVRPGHFDKIERQVLVRDGHYDKVERQVLVAEGRFEECKREVLVAEGHYENRIERVRVADHRGPFDVVNPILSGLNVEFRR